METPTPTPSTTDETAERVNTCVHDAAERVAEATVRAADTLCAKTGQMKAAEQRLITQARTYVNENPLTSIGIAVASGFLLSRLMSRR